MKFYIFFLITFLILFSCPLNTPKSSYSVTYSVAADPYGVSSISYKDANGAIYRIQVL